MPTLTLWGNDVKRIAFVAVRRGGQVRIKVESERPIRAYIVDDDGMDEFDDDDVVMFTTLAGNDRAATRHVLNAFIPRDTEWYLLLVNERDGLTVIHWEFF